MSLRVVMLGAFGAFGAVGQQVVAVLRAQLSLEQLTLLNRRRLPGIDGAAIQQHTVDVMDPTTYRHLLAVTMPRFCTLGVGQLSKIGKAEFVRVDKEAVIAFADTCRQAGITHLHFELLSFVGADAWARSFYLRTKRELIDALIALGFERLSIFQPSMILTPTNRYGSSQGLLLAMWPKLEPVLRGAWRKYRGAPVATLGAAMAANLVERLRWDDFPALASPE